mmetsp:Transcript_7277/g.13404  ORF Transcript_7277/g.13404 Transcript_7277/m.13404 type:complete len:101 (-) Transcript_7277:302-604(-)
MSVITAIDSPAKQTRLARFGHVVPSRSSKGQMIQAYMLNHLPTEVRHVVGMYALCAHRLDQGWREVHVQLTEMVNGLESTRTTDYTFFPPSANPRMQIRW